MKLTDGMETFEQYCRTQLNKCTDENLQLRWVGHIITLLKETAKLKLELKKLNYLIPFKQDEYEISIIDSKPIE